MKQHGINGSFPQFLMLFENKHINYILNPIGLMEGEDGQHWYKISHLILTHKSDWQ
jgi:hypothetical protein